MIILNYKDELKSLLSRDYIPGSLLEHDLSKTTLECFELFLQVYPMDSLTTHDVYLALIELGYKPMEFEPLNYKWYFLQKPL